MTGIHRGRQFGQAARIATAGAAAVAACAIGIMGSGAAHAQASPDAARKDFAAKIGVFVPAERDARRAGSTLNFYVEADATIQKLPALRSVSVLSVGYFDHQNFRMMPITIGQIFRDPNNASGKDYYYGLGLGIYPTRIEGFGTSSNNKNLFGGYIVLGLDVTPRIFVEGKYHYISKYDSKFVGGTVIAVGARF